MRHRLISQPTQMMNKAQHGDVTVLIRRLIYLIAKLRVMLFAETIK
jgi:hypothetical protein